MASTGGKKARNLGGACLNSCRPLIYVSLPAFLGVDTQESRQERSLALPVTSASEQGEDGLTARWTVFRTSLLSRARALPLICGVTSHLETWARLWREVAWGSGKRSRLGGPRF